ncbi:hypothetical protein GQ457_12G012780 [Hibiscus cannabinus]
MKGDKGKMIDEDDDGLDDLVGEGMVMDEGDVKEDGVNVSMTVAGSSNTMNPVEDPPVKNVESPAALSNASKMDAEQVKHGKVSSFFGEEVIVSPEDVIVDQSGAVLSIRFLDQVHDQVDNSMRNEPIVRLLGKMIGYKALHSQILSLWKPVGLPLRYYTKAIFCFFVVVLGSMVKINYNTQEGGCGKFARLSLLVDLNKPLRSCIRIDEECALKSAKMGANGDPGDVVAPKTGGVGEDPKGGDTVVDKHKNNTRNKPLIDSKTKVVVEYPVTQKNATYLASNPPKKKLTQKLQGKELVVTLSVKRNNVVVIEHDLGLLKGNHKVAKIVEGKADQDKPVLRKGSKVRGGIGKPLKENIVRLGSSRKTSGLKLED